jgi:signal transduction histidine kinase
VGVLVLRRVGTTQAYREAEKVALVAQRIVERRLTDGILTGSAESLLPLDRLVFDGVLADPIVRVKIRDPDGTILYYSDEPGLIGTSSPLDDVERRVLATGDVATEQVDLSLPENERERGLGPLLQVSLPISTTEGHELLFQASLRFESVATSGRELWSAFLPVLAIALLALALVQIPLAYRLARRVRESQRDRERLLRKAIEASDLERRRIASDLHDGVVQQLAGLSMSLAAGADSLEATEPSAARTLHEGADSARQGVRSLRSALMGIYPPNVQRAGLSAALSDLTAPTSVEGVETVVDVPADLDLPPEVESLLFRAAQEAIRNVAAHANARTAHLRVSRADGAAVLEVEDDGVGFAPERMSQARADGHLGLALLEDLATEAGGTVDVRSTPGAGTRVRLEVPVP